MSDEPQATDLTKPNYDRMAISRVIDRVTDPTQRDFLMAVVDVVAGISGTAQLRGIEDRAAVMEALEKVVAQQAELAKGMQETHTGMQESRRYGAATAANTKIVADSMKNQDETLKRQDGKIDGLTGLTREAVQRLGKLETQQANLEAGQAALSETLGGVVSRVSDLGEEVSSIKAEHSQRLDSHEDELKGLKKVVTTLVVDVGAVKVDVGAVKAEVSDIKKTVNELKARSDATAKLEEALRPPPGIAEHMDDG